jgi:hypothetical protein
MPLSLGLTRNGKYLSSGDLRLVHALTALARNGMERERVRESICHAEQ